MYICMTTIYVYIYTSICIHLYLYIYISICSIHVWILLLMHIQYTGFISIEDSADVAIEFSAGSSYDGFESLKYDRILNQPLRTGTIWHMHLWIDF
jgi:hypothetical protein